MIIYKFILIKKNALINNKSPFKHIKMTFTQ